MRSDLSTLKSQAFQVSRRLLRQGHYSNLINLIVPGDYCDENMDIMNRELERFVAKRKTSCVSQESLEQSH